MSTIRLKVKIVAVILSYWFVSISIVFLNKKLFSSISLNAPLTITWFQCLISVILCQVINKICRNCLLKHMNIFDGKISKKLFPVSVIFGLMVVSNNLCLKYVSVSFYYIGRCLTTIFNVVLTFAILHKNTSTNTLFFCIVIVIGFLLGINQENSSGTLSIIGLIFGILGSFLIALYSVVVKKALNSIDNDTWSLAYFNNCYSLILFLPLILLSNEIEEIWNFAPNFDSYYFLMLLTSGVFGFANGFLISLQIQVTSPLTNNVSGTAKSCLQTVLSTYWFTETKSILWWLSNFVVLLGSAGYARVKQLEMDSKYDLLQKTDVDLNIKNQVIK